MYHEESIINGVLHHRGTADGEWIPYTAAQLTTKIGEKDARITTLCNALDETKEELNKWQDAATHVGPRGIYG